MRFYTFFAFCFGLTGTLLELLSVPTLLNLGISGLCAFVFGWIAAWSFKRLYKNALSADVGIKRYIGLEARVLLPVAPNKRGKIVIQTPAGRVELPAETRDSGRFEPDDVVLIAHIDEGIANITSLTTTTSSSDSVRARPPQQST